jgi:hypothetical protein
MTATPRLHRAAAAGAPANARATARGSAPAARAALLLLLALVLPSARAHAAPQDSPGSGAGESSLPSRFEVADEARGELHALWESSAGVKQERVACLAGRAEGSVWRLTAIEPLASGRGDSLNVSAGASLAACAPPRFLGTVHTHVALRDGVHPYATFSGADRGVMRLWSERWMRRGVFCVLYSDRDAHCEMDGGFLAGPETRLSY